MSTTVTVILVMTLALIALTVTIVGSAVFLVRAISQELSRVFSTSHQTVTSPGEAIQATPTWQENTTVPWENWERPIEDTPPLG